MQDPLLQTRVPAPIFQRVRAVAEEQGDTVSGWLRRLVIKETRMARIAAWLCHERHADPVVHFTPGNHGHPTHFLEPLRVHSALERTFVLYGPDGYTPYTFDEWRAEYAFMRQSEHVFLLDGSANTWRIATLVGESTTGLLEISLVAAPTTPSFRTFADAEARYKQLGAKYSRTKGEGAEGRATLEAGSLHVSLDVAVADPDAMVLARLVAMLERGMGLQ